MSWSKRTSSGSNATSSRTDVKYLMTQALDFLVTESEKSIVLQNSYSNHSKWGERSPESSGGWSKRS